MATYTNLGIKKIAQGDEAGTWGTSTNTNLDIIDESLHYNSFNFSLDADKTLTVTDGVTGSSGSPSGREQILEFKDTGTVLTTTRSVIIQPSDLTKMWLFKNSTAQSLRFKMNSGDTGILVANGKDALLYSDGTGVMKQSESASPGVTTVTGTSGQTTASPTSGDVIVGLDNGVMRKIAGGNAATGTSTNNFYNGTNYSTYNFQGSLQIGTSSTENINIRPIDTSGNATVGDFYSSGYQVNVSSTFTGFTSNMAITTNGLTNQWTLPLCAPGGNNQVDVWWDINLFRDSSYQSGSGYPYYGEGRLISRSGLDTTASNIVHFTMGASNVGTWVNFGGLRFTTTSNVTSGHYIIKANTY